MIDQMGLDIKQDLHDLINKEKEQICRLNELLSQNIIKKELETKQIDSDFDKKRTFGERVADAVATFGGSWRFIIGCFLFLSMWCVLNVIILETQSAFDPYPFVFLNLILSMMAAIQAPIIMMSQNRQNQKDRSKLELDCQSDLKAEVLMSALHDKIDHLISYQCEHFICVQNAILDIINKLEK